MSMQQTGYATAQPHDNRRVQLRYKKRHRNHTSTVRNTGYKQTKWLSTPYCHICRRRCPGRCGYYDDEVHTTVRILLITYND